MKRRFFLYATLSIFLCTHLPAQNHSLSWKDLADEKAASPFVKGIYRFSAFTDGTVVLRNGIVYAERLNYSVLANEMHFINEKGDTLSIADPVTISFISLQGSKFYYEKDHYLQTISTAKDNHDITLACSQQFFKRRRYDDDGLSTDTVAGQYFSVDGRRYQLKSGDKLRITAKEYYFFGDKYAHFVKADKGFILQHYSLHQKDIDTFIKSSQISFNKPGDVLKLLHYCSGLTAR